MVYCSIDGGTRTERLHFLRAVEEVLSPIENPRYILSYPHRRWFSITTNYCAIPKGIGRRKDSVERYLQYWRRFVGPADVVYTREFEGRMLLLKINAQNLNDRKWAERLTRWTGANQFHS